MYAYNICIGIGIGIGVGIGIYIYIYTHIYIYIYRYRCTLAGLTAKSLAPPCANPPCASIYFIHIERERDIEREI